MNDGVRRTKKALGYILKKTYMQDWMAIRATLTEHFLFEWRKFAEQGFMLTLKLIGALALDSATITSQLHNGGFQ